MVFVHAEQTSFGQFATGQELLRRLKRPMPKTQEENVRIFIDLFDHRRGVQLCSLLAVAKGKRMIPPVAIGTDTSLLWGRENLNLQVSHWALATGVQVIDRGDKE